MNTAFKLYGQNRGYKKAGEYLEGRMLFLLIMGQVGRENDI